MLKHYIEEQVKRYEFMGHPAMLERFVLRNGHEGISRPRPAKIKKRADKECYKNSTDWILSKQGKGWTYVEGLAMRPSLGMIMQHAWVESPEHHVLDLTWREPEQCLYFGVPFTEEQLRAEILRGKVYGLLVQFDMYNDTLMLERDPELRAICDRVIEDRRAKRSPIFQIEGATA